MPEPEEKDNSVDQESQDSEPKQLREISDEELEGMLKDHRRWVESNGKDGKRVNILNLNLSGKKLYKANLSGAVLISADLTNSDLRRANLQNSVLTLSSIQGAKLYDTDFRNANLAGIKGLNKAELSGCNLEGARGLKGSEFARADLTGVKLPNDIEDFNTLKNVEETSKNARKIFLAVLLGCAYSWLTILSTDDVNLLTNSASSPLPIIGTPIPIAWFYFFAPSLLVGAYFYQHFYLQRLWELLAGLPAIFPDGKRLDERAYPWLLNGLIRRHFLLLKGKYPEIIIDKKKRFSSLRRNLLRLWYLKKGTRPLIHRLEEWVSIFLAWYVVPITLLFFWLCYVRRHDWTGTGLHIGVAVLSLIIGTIFYRIHRMTLRGQKSRNYSFRKFFKYRRSLQVLIIIAAAVLITILSMSAINHPGVFLYLREDVSQYDETYIEDYYCRESNPHIFDIIRFNTFANFKGKNVSKRPNNYWQLDSISRDNAIIGANLCNKNLNRLFAPRALLENADLSFARMHFAYLKNADIRKANLMLSEVWNAYLIEANLCMANLSYADFNMSNLSNAKLQGATLENIKMENVNLHGATLQGADLEKANLNGATLSNADLTEINLKGAYLRRADFFETNLHMANLENAKLQGANFWDADLQNANFLNANLQGARLKGADLRGVNLTREQLDQACGDSTTILPDYLGDYKMKPCPCDTCDNEEGE